MNIIIALSLLSVIVEAEISVEDQWKQFKTTYNKTYASEKEESHRFKIFKKNLIKIEQHNDKKSSYKKGINKFADLTQDEFKVVANIASGLGPPLGEYKKHNTYIPPKNKTLTLPFQIDWRNLGAVGNVKDQGRCGSCWSFSAIGAIEGQLAIKEGRFTSLSAQNLIDCTINDGCDGGWSFWAFDYVIEEGVASEDSYPYSGKNEDCRKNDTASVTKIKGYYVLPQGSEAWLQYFVGKMGPVSVSIHATAELQFYATGIFEDAACDTYLSNHQVLVVGYGVDKEGRDYWIIKNSWEAEWGQEGYYYLARNANNTCGVATEASIPFL